MLDARPLTQRRAVSTDGLCKSGHASPQNRDGTEIIERLTASIGRRRVRRKVAEMVMQLRRPSSCCLS
jgi:hypothetical protein